MKFMDSRRYQPCEWCGFDPAEDGVPLGSIRVDRLGAQCDDGTEKFLCVGCMSRAKARPHPVMDHIES